MMSDYGDIDGRNEEAEFEREDLPAKSVLLFLVGLAVVCVLVVLALKGMYVYLDGYERRHEPVQNPLVQTTADTRDVSPGDIAKFPQPRLETNEPREINDFRVQEERDIAQLWLGRPASRRGADSHRARHGTGDAARSSHPAAGRCGSAIGCKHGERSSEAVRYQSPVCEARVETM